MSTARLGSVINVTDYVANGSFESLRNNVNYLHSDGFAVLVRLVDYNARWTGPFVYTDRTSFEFLRKTTLRAGDVVIANVGANAGTVFQIPDLGQPMTLGPNAVLCRPKNSSELNNRFLYYWFRSPVGQSGLDSIIAGSAQPKFNKTDLRALPVPTPPLPEQQAIAEVLGALDDKIAANTKLAATAMELSHAGFHRASREIGFDSTTFADLAEIGGGGTPSTKVSEFWDGEVAWATPTDITALPGPFLDSTSRSISVSGLAACASKLYPAGAILMTSRATIGALAVAQLPTAVNQGFIVVEPNDSRLREWLFHEMQSRVDEFLSWANGATFLELSRGNFKKLPVRAPDDSTLSSFHHFAEPLHRSARQALLQNRTLAATRDALLPQLMSGKIRVRDAEKLASEAGA